MAFEKVDTSWFNDTHAYCQRCKENKPLSSFYKRADNHPAPVWATCKACWRKTRNRTQRARREMQRMKQYTIRYCENGGRCIHAKQTGGGPIKLRRMWELEICERCHRENVKRNVDQGVVDPKMAEEAIAG